MISWSWSWSKFDWIEELTQIDWLKIVSINHNAFSRLAYSRDVYTRFRCLNVYKQVVFLFNTPQNYLKIFCYIPYTRYMFN